MYQRRKFIRHAIALLCLIPASIGGFVKAARRSSFDITDLPLVQVSSEDFPYSSDDDPLRAQEPRRESNATNVEKRTRPNSLDPSSPPFDEYCRTREREGTYPYTEHDIAMSKKCEGTYTFWMWCIGEEQTLTRKEHNFACPSQKFCQTVNVDDGHVNESPLGDGRKRTIQCVREKFNQRDPLGTRVSEQTVYKSRRVVIRRGSQRLYGVVTVSGAVLDTGFQASVWSATSEFGYSRLVASKDFPASIYETENIFEFDYDIPSTPPQQTYWFEAFTKIFNNSHSSPLMTSVSFGWE